MAKELQANGHRVGRYMARSLMREAGIASRQRRRHKYKSPGVHRLANILFSQRTSPRPDQIKCGLESALGHINWKVSSDLVVLCSVVEGIQAIFVVVRKYAL
ncbi:hypothetical protein [Pseudomonas sp. ADAK13]|uniref:hypothetical protein n=1 Tax=Pseudomonas sp. ADAK13 TaxID=2730847 RepID=UPI003FA7BDD4